MDAYSGYDDLYHVRATIEWYTNNYPILSIDWTTYALVRDWCQYPDKLSLIVSILTARLKSTAPSSYKALILLQAVPVFSTIPLIEHLEPLSTNKENPYIASIALSLLEAAKAEKARVEEEEAKTKRQLWSNLYGHSRVGWLPLPTPSEPEWGWYGMRWVNSNQWWYVPQEKKEGE